MKLFGFHIVSADDNQQLQQKTAPSFVERDSDSSAAYVATNYAGYSGSYLDLLGTVKTEAELISKYRAMLVQPEMDNAVDEVVNEAICVDEEFIVKIDLDDLPLQQESKDVIVGEFNEILKLLDFKFHCHNIFKKWYVDGRLYYHAVIDNQHPEYGIKELRYIDPRKIREIKEVEERKLSDINQTQGQIGVITVKNEYYLFNERGFGGVQKQTPGLAGVTAGGLRIAKDSIIHVPSGLTDPDGNLGLSYLHIAMKVMNQLRTIEDALIIYRLARAPERRAWYIDVGDMPRVKADQYVRDIMVQQKNRLIYDAATGNIKDDRNFMTMLEDYWIPRRGDGSGTRVDTLQGGKTLGEIDDILYFQKQLYNSLKVPVSRLNPEESFSPFGADQGISRDELKFNKFVNRLRGQFSLLFKHSLQRQVVLKGLMTMEEWKAIEKDIQFEFAVDNHFAEMKESQVLMARLQSLELITPYIGTYFSHKNVRRNILKQTDEDIEKMTMEILEEMQDPLYQMAAQNAAAAANGEGGGNLGGPEEGADGGSGGGGGDSAASTSDQGEQPGSDGDKIANAQHVVQALSDVKKKTPGDVQKLRSAAQTLSKSK